MWPLHRSECNACPKGTFQQNVTCVACGAGQYQGSESATRCEVCPPGRYTSSTGDSACDSCSAGTFVAAAGAVGCSSCPLGYNSEEGSAACDLAAVNYFLAVPGEARAAVEGDEGVDTEGRRLLAGGSLGGSAHQPEQEARRRLGESCLVESTADPYCAESCPLNANCAGGRQGAAPNKDYWVRIAVITNAAINATKIVSTPHTHTQ